MSFSFELNLTFNSKKKMIWIKALSLIYYCVASRYSFIKDANEWVWRIKRVVEDLNRWCMGRRVWWTRDLSFIDFESRNSGDVHLNFRWWIWNLAWLYDEQVSFSVCVCSIQCSISWNSVCLNRKQQKLRMVLLHRWCSLPLWPSC